MSSQSEALRIERLEQFAQELRAFGRVRLRAADLWAAFGRAFPARPPGVERAWLLAALEEAERRGIVRLPPPRSTRWDRSAEPYIPAGADLVREGSANIAAEWRTFPWVPELSWVPDLARLSTDQADFLRRAHEGIVRGRFLEPAPLRHRSLQLTGDEKRLERLMKTALFGEGRLSLELIGAYREVSPLAWESVHQDGGRVLVLENAGPFTVARSVLASLGDPPYDIVAYGAGSGFTQSVAHLATIGRAIEVIHYVGDLDAPGLSIATGAAATAAEAGLPKPSSAPGLHAAMISAAAKMGHPDGWLHEEAGDMSRFGDDLAFLPAEIRATAGRVIRAGRRIPEEVLGPEIIREAWTRNSDLISDISERRYASR